MMRNISVKGIILVSAVCSVMGILSCDNDKEKQSDTGRENDLIFAKGEKISNDNFTGTVWLNNLVTADSSNRNAVGSVTFEPEARTKWHSHPSGQIILALDGVGYYQEEGKDKIIIRKGEVVKCPVDVPHWHGASADTAFIQIAITGREKGETKWLNSVTDEEFLSGVKH